MAFKLPIPQCVLADSATLSLQASIGKRGDVVDGSHENQLVGMIGENLILHHLGFRKMEVLDGVDCGFDFEIMGKKIDVKTMGRTSPPTLDQTNALFEHQAQSNVDAYIFCNLLRKEMKMAICGWIPKTLFMERATYYPAGFVKVLSSGKSITFKSGNYEIKNSDIYFDSRNIAELLYQITHWCKN